MDGTRTAAPVPGAADAVPDEPGEPGEPVAVRVLGPVDLVRGGVPVPLAGPRQQALLACLALEAPRPVPAGELLTRAWPARATPNPGTLHYQVASLRTLLEPDRPARAAPRLLVRTGAGYALRLPGSAIDCHRAGDLAARGAQALRAGDVPRALPLLQEAAGSWRGRTLAELDDLPALAAESARWEELRSSATEDLIDALDRSARHDEAVASARRHTARHPLRERGWYLLARALYRADRQADALAALRSVRAVLAGELGIDPGPQLRDLERAVLAHDEALLPDRRAHHPTASPLATTAPSPPAPPVLPAAGADPAPPTRTGQAGTPPGGRAEPAPPSAPPSVPSSLPGAVTELVGRDEEVVELTAQIGRHRLVTLTGPGGVGKTRLALAVAAGAGTPVTWVDVSQLDGAHLGPGTGDGQLPAGDAAQEEGLLCSVVATALDLPAARDVPALTRALGAEDRLLVLDDCERHLPAVAALSGLLLRRCPRVHLLLTSREFLDVPGEVVHVVEPLDPCGAGTRLFCRRAAAADPRWRPQPGELDLVQRICTEVDGLPLAIELAASRIRVLSSEQILQALDDRFGLLRPTSGTGPGAGFRAGLLAAGPHPPVPLPPGGGPGRPGPPTGAGGGRVRDLEDVVRWSCDALDPAETRCFLRWSVFAGPFDLAAAAQVGEVSPARALAVLSSLVRRSLLSVEAGSTPRRYRLLQTLRVFAASRLSGGERESAQAQHRAWVLGTARAAQVHLRGPGAATALAALRRAAADHRAAFASADARGDRPYAQALAAALAWAWYRHGDIVEGREQLHRALSPAAPAAADTASVVVRPVPRAAREEPAGEEPAGEGTGGDRAGALLGLGQLEYLAGEGAAATGALTAARVAATGSGQPALAARSATWAAHVLAFTDARAALQQVRAAVALADETGDDAVLAEALMVQGMAMRTLGDPGARTVLHRAVAVARRAGHGWAVTSSTWALMKAALDGGDHRTALSAAAEMRRSLTDDGDLTSWLVLVHTSAAALAAWASRTGTVEPAEQAALLLGAVHHLGQRWNFSPEAMDPVDGPREAATVRAALPAHRLRELTDRGRGSSREQVDDLLAAALGSALRSAVHREPPPGGTPGGAPGGGSGAHLR